MPAKNSKLKTRDRFNHINVNLFKRFKEKHNVDIDYSLFRAVIERTNEVIKETISETEDGVTLPEGLGNIVVTKYKSKKVPTDWINSIKYKRKIPLLNLHSLGYVYHIKWFRIGIRFKNARIYNFQPYRILKRRVAKNIKDGVVYHTWEASDFWSSTKMERIFNKFYKK